MNYDINKEEIIYELEEVKISDKSCVKKLLVRKRGNEFFDIIFYLEDKEIFLGRFESEKRVSIKYNNGKILIYNEEFKEETKKMEIIKVLSLYEILDDTFYSCTEEEALNIFLDITEDVTKLKETEEEKEINFSFLKDKDKYIHRSDLEKERRLK